MREPTDQEILDILAEECAEVIHIISKVRRFGIDDVHPKTKETNKKRLQSEVIDVLAMLDWYVERNDFMTEDSDEVFENKRDKVRKYLR